jgi:hypothetical protein
MADGFNIVCPTTAVCSFKDIKGTPVVVVVALAVTPLLTVRGSLETVSCPSTITDEQICLKSVSAVDAAVFSTSY